MAGAKIGHEADRKNTGFHCLLKTEKNYKGGEVHRYWMQPFTTRLTQRDRFRSLLS